MKNNSAIINKKRKELIRMHQRMTPEERLKAYVMHCQLLDQIYQAGKTFRSKSKVGQRKIKRIIK